MERLPLFLRKALAWGVHLFTATGAVWGFLAIRAIFVQEWKTAIIWMGLALFVDGFDGIFARWLDVKTYASEIDGALLDNILDYFNYVVVPALFLIEAELLPSGFAMAGAIAILLTSAYQFTQVDAKTDSTSEYFFKGFPDYWNVMVIYMLVLGLNHWLNLGLLLTFQHSGFCPHQIYLSNPHQALKKINSCAHLLFWGARFNRIDPIPQ